MVTIEMSDDEALELMLNRTIAPWLRDRIAVITGTDIDGCPSAWLYANVRYRTNWDSRTAEYMSDEPWDWEAALKNNNKIGCIKVLRELVKRLPNDFNHYFPNKGQSGDNMGLAEAKRFVEQWPAIKAEVDGKWHARRRSLKDCPELLPLVDL